MSGSQRDVRSTNVPGTLGDHQRRIQILEAVVPGGSCGAWQIPTLINSWTNAGTPYCDIAYRLCGDELEFMGHVTGGASGTIAFYLDSDFWPDCDLSTITDVIATPLGAAQIYVASADGAVTITTII